ncbi:DExH-box splicing factor binding site-domain-containing protein [Blastocladiella britannica]|nr:DExH-box splicing factor binding site-domain-containing protein [Blastocladiella britannica]
MSASPGQPPPPPAPTTSSTLNGDRAPIAFGLNVPQRRQVAGSEKEGENGASSSTPLLSGRQSFEADMASLPDPVPFSGYDAAPVGDFGTAMLQRMGWREGDPIGRNKASGLAKPIMYIPRPERLGLGAQPMPDNMPPPTSSRSRGRSRRDVPQYEQLRDEHGRVQHVRDLDTELERKRVLEPGAAVEIMHGRHEGLLGVAVEVLRARDRVVVELAANGDQVRVATGDVRVLKDADYHRKLEASSRRHHHDNERDRPHSEPATNNSWLRPHLQVRIVSKTLGSGRYYERKARVLDVIPNGRCSLQTEHNGSRVVLDNVAERDLETTVPRVSDSVCLVRVPERAGRGRSDLVGQRGRILEKDRARQECVVNLDEGEVVVAGYDDVCGLDDQ